MVTYTNWERFNLKFYHYQKFLIIQISSSAKGIIDVKGLNIRKEGQQYLCVFFEFTRKCKVNILVLIVSKLWKQISLLYIFTYWYGWLHVYVSL